MTLGIMRPTICTTEGSSFRHWREQDIENAKAGNCLAILTFAWAYILSARLVELQGGSIQYTQVLAPIDDSKHGVQTRPRDIVVDIGNSDSTAVHWWRAILAYGQGWRATAHEYPAHLSPWSISYQGRQSLKVRLPPGTSVEDDSEHSCPSSSQAMGYLADFCDLHNLRSQPSAGLAAALLLPLHNTLREEATLPEIVLVESHDTAAARLDFHEEENALPYLMTLSCTARMLDSAIWGVFWEPGVDCNLVSAWFRPILDNLTPIIKSGNFELLAQVMALRRPKLASLWLGSIITGLTPNRIIPFLQHLEGTVSCPDPDVAAWTSSPQSFMDLRGSGAYVRDSKIRRADVWRLRYDCRNDYPPPSPYQNPPLTGWPPFGSVPHSSVDLEVWLHTQCNRHTRLYSHWNWVMADGKPYVDYGFNNSCGVRSPPTNNIEDVHFSAFRSSDIMTLEINDEVSEEATRVAFAWATDAGYNPEIETVFNHPWLGVGDHDDDSDASSAADSTDFKDVSNGNFFIERFLAEPVRGYSRKRSLSDGMSSTAGRKTDLDVSTAQTVR